MKVALALSLAANVALALWFAVHLHGGAKATLRPSETPRPAADRVVKAVPAQVSELDDPAKLANWMKATGFPENVRQSAVAASLAEKNGFYRYSELISKGDREAMAKAARITEESLVELTALTGFRLGPRTDRQHELKFGSISEQSIATIQRLEQQGLAGRALESAIRAQVAANEAEDFLKFNSVEAVRVQSRLNAVELTEDEYSQLYLEETKRATAPTADSRDQPSLLGEYFKVLGAERFVVVAGKIDATAATIDLAVNRRHVDPVVRAGAIILADQYLAEARTWANNPTARANRIPEIRRALVDRFGLAAEDQAILEDSRFWRALQPGSHEHATP